MKEYNFLKRKNKERREKVKVVDEKEEQVEAFSQYKNSCVCIKKHRKCDAFKHLALSVVHGYWTLTSSQTSKEVILLNFNSFFEDAFTDDLMSLGKFISYYDTNNQHDLQQICFNPSTHTTQYSNEYFAINLLFKFPLIMN